PRRVSGALRRPHRPGMKTSPLKYISEDPGVGNADDSSDAAEETGKLKRLVAGVREELYALSSGAAPLRRADLLLQLGRALVRLEQGADGRAAAREAFGLDMAEHCREGAGEDR